MTDAAVFQARGIGKSYPGVRANDDVSFAVEPGEIHALLGENGAGKSTLMKLLAGVHQPDAGTIEIDGKVVPVCKVGPVAYSEGVRMATQIYAGRTIEDGDNE